MLLARSQVVAAELSHPKHVPGSPARSHARRQARARKLSRWNPSNTRPFSGSPRRCSARAAPREAASTCPPGVFGRSWAPRPTSRVQPSPRQGERQVVLAAPVNVLPARTSTSPSRIPVSSRSSTTRSIASRRFWARSRWSSLPATAPAATGCQHGPRARVRSCSHKAHRRPRIRAQRARASRCVSKRNFARYSSLSTPSTFEPTLSRSSPLDTS